jgi:signal transduction histidine kinase
MPQEIIRPLLDALSASLGVPVRTSASAPADIRRAALQAVSESNLPIAPFTIDGRRYLALRYHQRRGALALLGPYRRMLDPESESVLLQQADEERAMRALQAAALSLEAAVEERRQRLELASQLEVATSSVIAVTGELALDTVLRRIVDLARQLAGARYAALGVPNERRELTAFLTSGMTDEQEARIGERPKGRGILGLLLEEPRTIRLVDLTQHPASAGFPPEHPAMKSFLGVPIVARGRVLGNLYLTDKLTQAEFTEKDARLVEILARHAAVAIENARLYESLEREQKRLRIIVDQLPEAVLIIERDPDRVTLVNRQTSHLLGWEIQTPIDLWEFLAANQRATPEGVLLAPGEAPIIEAIWHGNVVTQREVRITRPDGSVITVLLNAAPIKDAQGHVTGAIAVFQDITLIKDAEQLKDDFLSIVSHELRTPLTTIRGGSTMLLRDAERLDEETKTDILTDMSQESNRLAILIENMVQLAHIRAGRLTMETEPVHVRSAIDGAIAAERQQLGERECLVDCAPGLVAAADPRSLDQVLRNLLHNAMKYSPDGSPIDIQATGDGAMVTIAVRDYGIGIPEADLPHVFERFRRAGTVEARRIPGMGLGLYLCRELIEAHGGRIWIESPSGGGTSVAFSLPAATHDD